MRYKDLFGKTIKETPKGEIAKNAILLERGGFIYKNSAGVYSFLPLGWRVIEKIVRIIREEINAIGGQEMFMPALIERKYLEATNRWGVGIGFKTSDKGEGEEATFVLGWSHEDILTVMATKYINSYRDLPISVYQIQTKFRNEPRAKSGLLRGREFIMKDLYSFHATEEDLDNYYEKVKEAYFKIFDRCSLKAVYALAAGGVFTISNTHEFQVLTNAGEDTILYCTKCGYAENNEISNLNEGSKCPKCEGKVVEKRSVEVGNTFPLGTKYSKAVGLEYLDKDGAKKPVIMGSYGIGVGRLMGTVVEIHNDDRGIIWPISLAPYQVYLSNIGSESKIIEETERVYQELLNKNVDVLYDDRDVSPGTKLADSDLIGLPVRLVISKKTLNEGKVEYKERQEETLFYLSIREILQRLP
ncbi:MAG: His/Gly/Thr/Pro-type tRNA ligase C-terminal domain-containing protein [Patescibacteria group bacterium]|nr:His/Gly/Thr/Pro-type tRNA ligase C-terminal domain-containing protein [Patescibacteria group bacterium]